MNPNNFELLLPVGHKEMALAAIHNGADAIFVGFPGFNARGRSYDHELTELQEIIQTCHLYGVKVNLAFNIVIFENELDQVVEAIKKVLPLKPDALIVQDLGLVNLIRQIAPNQVIHGSTQMTVTNDLAIELLSDLNIKRFVLGRENSLSEIKLIKKSTEKELEVFVHGALCVSYSGQCFTSESIGGRSANRGQCAQSCRFSYDLIVDGEKKSTVDRDYLVSPQDLCGIAEIPELMEIGVNSFKVEGRLKSPEYVASVASSYKDVMNKTLDNEKYTDVEMNQFKHKMAVNYSRGFFPGWLHGVNHQQLVDGTFSSHRGSRIGTITEVLTNAIVIKTENEVTLQNGDGLLFALVGTHGKNKLDIEKGSFIFSVSKKSNKTYQVGLDNNLRLDLSYLNAEVYQNHDKEQKKEIQKSYNDKNFFKRVPVRYEVTVEMGQPLKVTLSDEHHKISVQSESKIDLAKTKGVTEEIIRDELNALSGTVFILKDIKFNWITQEPAFISNKEVKQLRQKATEQLAQLRTQTRVDGWETTLDFDYQLKTVVSAASSSIQKTKLVVLLREKPQVASLVEAILSKQLSVQSLDSVILDFEFGRDYLDSIELLKKNNIKVGIATTRILKPQEYQNLKNIKNMDPDFVLARNLGAVHYFKNVNPLNKEIRGDFSLNITNHFSAEYLLNKGLSTACVSYDLNSDQLNLLLQNSDAQKLEVTVHQAMPSFHMEHCVFAAFLSKGSSYKDCGKPCEKHKVQLKDQFGHHHWIKPDHECRNTMYNAKSQTALPFLSQWQKHHIGFIRYEALYEQGAELIKKISAYLNVLDGQQTSEQASQSLETVESYGLSSGNLAKQQEYQSRKKSVDGAKL
jgi:U32 family peptidase